MTVESSLCSSMWLKTIRAFLPHFPPSLFGPTLVNFIDYKVLPFCNMLQQKILDIFKDAFSTASTGTESFFVLKFGSSKVVATHYSQFTHSCTSLTPSNQLPTATFSSDFRTSHSAVRLLNIYNFVVIESAYFLTMQYI